MTYSIRTNTMNKTLILLGIILIFSSISFAETQELPDVEITGPSVLKTTTTKGSILYNEILIPDVVDSLKPVLPKFPQEAIIQKKQSKYGIFIDIGSNIDIKVNLIADKLLSKQNSATACVDYTNYKKDWSYLYINSIAHRDMDNADIDVVLKVLSSYSPGYIKEQYNNSLGIRYHFSNRIMKKYPIDIILDNVIHNNQIDYGNIAGYGKQTYTKNNLITNVQISPQKQITLDLLYNQKTPLLIVKTAFIEGEEEKPLSMIKEISIALSNYRIAPGIHISKRFIRNSVNSFHLFQESSVIARNNADFASEYYWLNPLDKGLVTFKPINLSVIWNNSSFRFAQRPVVVETKYNITYSIDEPILVAFTNSLPQVYQIRALYNSANVSGLYAWQRVSINQSIELVKGWNCQSNFSSIAYQPLFKLNTELAYKDKAYLANLWVKQSYHTKNELNQIMRESIELSTRIAYNVRQDFMLYGQADNVLDKGLVTFRTFPASPRQVKAGFIYIF